MEVMQGKASQIRSSVDVSGGYHGIFVNSKHIALFQIDQLPIKVIATETPVIQENDDIKVSGVMKNGQLSAYAYHNLSTTSKGDRGYLRKFFGSAMLIIIGICLWFYLGSELGYGIEIVSGFIILLGLYYLNVGKNILQAVKDIE